MNLIISEKLEKTTPTICLNMIVKNESKIITRILNSVLPIINTYCICDTGSTDNTISLIENYFKERNIEGKIINIPFKNFGYNRTEALKSAKNMATYLLLLDADMKLEINDNFTKNDLIEPAYLIEQGDNSFKYSNIRLVKSDLDITCISVTHEYYNLPNNISPTQLTSIKINDIGDGGCKQDKFERDIKLLTQGIKDEPKNNRYYFYLANSYYDTDRFDLAIETYKKRIELGGWIEDVWYSYYRLGLCYHKKNITEKAILTWLEGYNYYPKRAENIYEIVKHYRITGQHQLAYHFYKLGNSIPYPYSDSLFIHTNVYNYLFDYELSIIAYYITPRPSDMIKCYMKLFNINTDFYNNLLSNYKFYAPQLSYIKNIDLKPLISDLYPDFVSSSPSIIPYKNGYMVNIRFVDYKVNTNGTYTYQDGYSVNTKHARVLLDQDFKLIEKKCMREEINLLTQIRGIEDLKIIEFFGIDDIIYIGNIQDTSGNIQISIGNYTPECDLLKLDYKLPNLTSCEKNWALFNHDNKLKFIYKWYPITIGIIQKSTSNFTSLESPAFFSNLRGSSNGFLYNNEYWFVGHYVEYSKPRCYYHCIVILDGETLEYKRHSILFTFSKEKIEFCLGLIIEDNRIIMSHSSWDRTSEIKIYNKELLKILFDY